MDYQTLTNYIRQGKAMVEKYLLQIVSKSGGAIKKEQLSIAIYPNMKVWVLHGKIFWKEISLSHFINPFVAFVAEGKIKKRFIDFAEKENLDITKIYGWIRYSNGELKSCIAEGDRIIQEIDFEQLVNQEVESEQKS